jgi:hypothetical protein
VDPAGRGRGSDEWERVLDEQPADRERIEALVALEGGVVSEAIQPGSERQRQDQQQWAQVVKTPWRA